ncbi:MAG: radical SAM family heme chaperone HemW [Legionellaceae bacterium]|nr:radical SAM family heme chaperone HemW [Legionellaceae bacterium]
MRSLYIHVPWCIRKCPYCDFNSHEWSGELPEKAYVDTLIQDVHEDIARFGSSELGSIFIGGGTPSVLSGEAYARLFDALSQCFTWENDIEITLEANPGTVDQQRFKAYRLAGINRLSLGVQSFSAKYLKALGRIHDGPQAEKAILLAQEVGFTNFNIDLMYGLPGQSAEEASEDLLKAFSFQPKHLSWYELTIEPNTQFYKKPPSLPKEEHMWAIEQVGLQHLEAAGYHRYEISAFSKPGYAARHNLQYWQYGDYYGIGAGAHGKLHSKEGIFRTQKHKMPKAYLDPQKPFLSAIHTVTDAEKIFEFMLNTTRLLRPIPIAWFTQQTGLPVERIIPFWDIAQQKGFLERTAEHWQLTSLGRRYTNDVQAIFL